MSEFPCDLCGSGDALEVPHVREFTGGQAIHICAACGFVYVRERRSADDIAASWTEDIFGAGYTARIPAVTARLTYVAETLDVELGLAGKDVCEIGAGEGEFLAMLKDRYGARVFGIEPSPANCERMRGLGVECFAGTIEAYDGAEVSFDLVTILWTLENCQDCVAMLRAAHRLLKPGGHVAVATGSRILVPFKKPLWTYFGSHPADTHAFRFSANTLRGAQAVAGFAPAFVNRYLDHDVLLAVGRRADGPQPWEPDDALQVWGFFDRWYADTVLHYPRGD